MHVIPAREGEARRQGLAGGLITGSTDGTLQLWTAQLELGRTVACAPLLKPQAALVHSCAWDEANHKLMVAFWSAEVSPEGLLRARAPLGPKLATKCTHARKH
jgi:hypothetical protein